MNLEALNIHFLKNAVEAAIEVGVPAAYLAYLLLLPFLTSLIAASRHLLGFATHNTFIPAVIAVIWLEIGLPMGFLALLFLFIWTWLTRKILKRTLVRMFKINYLPRMSILLLFISLGVLIMALVPQLSFVFKERGIIFPFLVMVLVVQALIEDQVNLSKKEARTMIGETVIFSLAGYGLLNWSALRNLVLDFPGLTILSILLFNILVGRYVGFRLLEYRRFWPIIRKSSKQHD